MWRYQLVRRVYNEGKSEEEAIISVHAAYFPSADAEIPDSISIGPAGVHGASVAEVAEQLRLMAKTPDYPLLNWHGFGPGGDGKKFVFDCRQCHIAFTSAVPILKCPVDHDVQS